MREGIDCKGRKWREMEVPKNVIDISGQKFYKLTVMFLVKIDKKTYWLCKCDCGNEIICRSDGLKTGHTKSCGCWKVAKLKNKDDDMRQEMIGRVFGYLTVVEIDCFKQRRDGTNQAYYRCQCVCGNSVSVSGNALRCNFTKSCGCRTGEMISRSNTKDLTNKRFGKLVALSIDKQINGRTFWKCKCDCGHIVSIRSDGLLSGHINSCGCESRMGEKNIQTILLENNISFKKEQSFSDLLSQKGKMLRYDFGIIENSEIVRLVEFDGPQHEQPVEYFGGVETFMRTQYNDALKNQYALSHNIPLVRIPYSRRDNITYDDIFGDKYVINNNYN